MDVDVSVGRGGGGMFPVRPTVMECQKGRPDRRDAARSESHESHERPGTVGPAGNGPWQTPANWSLEIQTEMAVLGLVTFRPLSQENNCQGSSPTLFHLSWLEDVGLALKTNTVARSERSKPF